MCLNIIVYIKTGQCHLGVLVNEQYYIAKVQIPFLYAGVFYGLHASWHIYIYIANNIIFVAEPHCHADTAMKSQLKINECY